MWNRKVRRTKNLSNHCFYKKLAGESMWDMVPQKGGDIMGQQIGVITEIGDMGLGFEPLNETDQMKYDKSQKEKEDKDEEKDK